MKTSTTKILTIAVILLLLINIAMIILMVKGKHRHENEGPRGKSSTFEMMEKELNMTEQQKAAHQKFRDDYFAAVRPLFDSVRAAKQAFFALVKDSTASDSLINSYSRRIAERQMAADKLTFEHFRRVRALYSGEQQIKYDELVKKIIQRSPGDKRRDSINKEK